MGRLGGETRVAVEHAREAGGDGPDERRQQAVGAAHDAVLLVQHGRDAAQRRRHQRRHGRIAAETDHHCGAYAAEH
jgi:hypothetical protein